MAVKVGDKVMLANNVAYKYETPYNGPFFIKQCWTNETGTLQCGAIKIGYNISRIKPYKSGTNVKDINPKYIYDNVNI